MAKPLVLSSDGARTSKESERYLKKVKDNCQCSETGKSFLFCPWKMPKQALILDKTDTWGPGPTP